MESYYYKIRQSSWGIYIKIDWDIFTFTEIQEDYIRVDDGMFLDVSAVHITTIQIDYLILGIKLIAKRILDKIDSNIPLVIKIINLEFNIADYQHEGLACAIGEGLAIKFNIKMPDVSVTFDSSKNKYIFQF